MYRPSLDQLRSALDTTRTVAQVDLVASAWTSPGGRGLTRLADAYIELRRGVLTEDRRTLTDAWESFDAVVRLHPDWPYARLGLALAALEVYSRRYPLPANYDDVAGGTHYDGFTIQMKRTLREEPDFAPAVDWLALMMSDEGDRDQPGAILDLLRYVADSTGSSDPRLELILGRAERLHGQPQASLSRFDAYLAKGGDAGVADLEVARTFAWLDLLDRGAQEYLAGAAVTTTAARTAYRLDLSWVATPRELARFDSLPPDSVAAYVQQFWTRRDARDLRPEGSRLEEHLRRWVFINQNFRVPDPGRRTAYREVFIPYDGLPCTESGARSLDDYDYIEPARQGGYRAPERVFDHRAIVYMRHGEPAWIFNGFADSVGPVAANRESAAFDGGAQRRITATAAPFASLNPGLMGPNTEANMTWVYLIQGKVRAFTFLGHQALGSNVPSTMVVSLPPNLDVLLALGQVSPSYSRLASMMQWNSVGGSATPLSCQTWYREVVREQREGAAVAVKTDTYLRRFDKPINAAIQFATLGETGNGSGLLLAVVAVRAAQLTFTPMRSGTGVQAEVRIQLAAMDSLTGEAVRMDSVRTLVSAQPIGKEDAWLQFVTTMPLRPGLTEVRLAVEQGEEHGSVYGAPLDPAASGFSASDIVLGSERGGISWRRQDAAVSVTGFSTYHAGDVVPLYQELYGLAPGGEYRTMVSLRRAGDTKVASSVTFRDRAATSTMTSSRAITLTDMKPGVYDLAVTVEEVASGRRVVRQRSITIGGS